MVALAVGIIGKVVPPAKNLSPTGLALLCFALSSSLVLTGCFGRAAPAAAPGQPAPPIINVLPPPLPPPPPPIKSVTVVLHAAPDINPGMNERPAPVLVRVYELKASTAFDAADYFALAEKDRESLGGDLINRDDYQVKPGERLQATRKLNASTRRLAAMVSFRDLERSVWKASIAISDPPPDEIRILIDTRRVQVLAQ